LQPCRQLESMPIKTSLCLLAFSWFGKCSDLRRWLCISWMCCLQIRSHSQFSRSGGSSSSPQYPIRKFAGWRRRGGDDGVARAPATASNGYRSELY
jgi:hypothetical protein